MKGPRMCGLSLALFTTFTPASFFTPYRQSDELYTQITYEFQDGIQKHVWSNTSRIKPRRDEAKEKDRGLKIEDRAIGRKTILDLRFSILDLRLYAVLFL